MSEALNKFTSYHILNNLLPGIVFVVFAKAFTPYSFVQGDLLLGVALYYFIGMVISRLGSVMVEPILKSVGFVEFRPYAEFVQASTKDSRLDTLSETNNIFRSLCALFLALILVKGYSMLAQACPAISTWGKPVLIVGLFLLFLFAYRKQTAYITKRIRSVLST